VPLSTLVDEQERVIALLDRGHIPGSVDGRVRYGLHDGALGVQHQQATRLSRSRGPIRGRQTSYHHPARWQDGQRGGESDAAGARAGKRRRVDLANSDWCREALIWTIVVPVPCRLELLLKLLIRMFRRKIADAYGTIAMP